MMDGRLRYGSMRRTTGESPAVDTGGDRIEVCQKTDGQTTDGRQTNRHKKTKVTKPTKKTFWPK
jgi:hypothetical protein